MTIKLEDYFRYHPPITEERKRKHNEINDTALDLAKVIDTEVEDEDCKKMALFAVQQARMFANQGITVDELKLKQSNLYKLMNNEELPEELQDDSQMFLCSPGWEPPKEGNREVKECPLYKSSLRSVFEQLEQIENRKWFGTYKFWQQLIRFFGG